MGDFMSSIVVSGDTSGAITLAAPAVAGTNTLTLPAQTGTVVVGGPIFSAYQSTLQGLTGGTPALCQLQTEEFDPNGCFNNTGSTVTLNGISTPAYAFAPNVAGYYQVFCAYQVVSGAVLYPNIWKNGSQYRYGLNTTGANLTSGGFSTLMYLNGTGDYIQFYVYSNSSQNTVVGITNTYFQANFVRAA